VDFYFVTLPTPTIDFWGHPVEPPAAVPEPSTWLLMLVGVTTCILLGLRGKHQNERRR
jgi:hypothetical protein